MKFMMQSLLMVENTVCDGGSRMLKSFCSPISATVYKKCIDEGMEFVGLLSQTEFGLDGAFSSKGDVDSALCALLNEKCDFVLCNDVFGKISRQASEKRLFFINSAYGTVSRYGVMQAVSSMDRIGILCKEISVGIKILDIISGCDEKDSTTVLCEHYNYSFDNDSPVRLMTNSDVDMKYFDIIHSVFYILASAEICNNTNRYDGIKYGYSADGVDSLNELYVKSRSEGFSRDLKLLSILGCMVLSKENYGKYYYKAMQLRRCIREYYLSVFEKTDVLVIPYNFDGSDEFSRLAPYALPSLCGFFSVSLSFFGKQSLLICPHGKEKLLFSVLKEGKYERI